MAKRRNNHPDSALPHDVVAEQAVLGAAFLKAETVDTALEAGLLPTHFFRPAHRKIFHAMVKVHEQSQDVEPVAVLAALNGQGEACGGAVYLSQLMDSIGTAANAGHYARLIKGHAKRREVIRQGQRAIQLAHTVEDVDLLLDEVETGMLGVREGSAKSTFKPLGAGMKDFLRGLEQRRTRRDSVVGTPSGYRDLDKKTAGFHAGDLIILAGRPSMGKTAFALDLSLNITLSSEPRGVAFFSLEMNEDSLIQRMAAQYAAVSLQGIRTGEISEADTKRVVEAATCLASAPVLIDETPALSILEIRSRGRQARRYFDRLGVPLGLVVVDYLTLIKHPKANSTNDSVAEITRSLKALAKELNAPVMALSQLSRKVEDRPDKRPRLSDLRDSGAIEQDADLVLFVYRPVVYTKKESDIGIAEIILGKQRNGPIGTVELRFQAPYTRFLGKECW